MLCVFFVDFCILPINFPTVLPTKLTNVSPKVHTIYGIKELSVSQL